MRRGFFRRLLVLRRVTTLRALVFDVDGTLAETERDGHRVAYNAAFADLGLPWQWDAQTYGKLLHTAGGKERLRAYIATAQPAFAGAGLDALVARVHEAKNRHFGALARGLQLRPGVLRIVRAARQAGIRIGIATTASRSAVDALLRAYPELAAALDVLGAGDVVAQKKPAPDIYRWTLERLAIGSREALAIEDSALGLRSALAAGIATLVTPSDYTAAEDFAGAAAVLSDLGEPGAPARTLWGPPPPRGYADLAYARELLASGSGPDVA